VLQAAQRIPGDIGPRELAGRTDLQSLPFVTVDGEDARDFDDAVAWERGNTLWVAIADVGHYVTPGDPLDREAAARANSYYFPDCVLPMLPERLSNDLCSLRPGEDRLVLAARMELDERGRVLRSEFREAVIRSRARLTYEGVDRGDVPPELAPMVREMQAVSESMYRLRIAEGGIDFDIPEARVELGPGGATTGLLRRERTPSQRLIEEFMLAANQAAARTLSEAGVALPYRVHDGPDSEKLGDFLRVLRAYGYTVKKEEAVGTAQTINRLLARLAKDPRRKVFAYHLLRSMAQARYSERNIGHFGLGFPLYCHFTSPIRRYADLLVHRALRRRLRGERKPATDVPPGFGSLENVALHMSERERVAAGAEREIVKLKGIRFLADKIGNSYAGLITGLVSKGLFVELEEHAIEGFVHVTRMGGDRYEFSEPDMVMKGTRRGKTFRLGDRIRVRVEEASLPAMRIEFSLAGP
jgi:ribonuclease R